MGVINSFFIYLFSLAVDIYLYFLVLRLLLQKMQGPYYNPISQFVIKLTEPVVRPLQRFLPVYQGIDLAILFAAIILELIFSFIIFSLQIGVAPNLLGLLLFSIATIADKVINLFFFSVIIAALISWFPALQTSPITPLVFCLSTPLTNKARHFIPPIGGIDLSPIFVLLVLKLFSIIILYPIAHLGINLILQPLITKS